MRPIGRIEVEINLLGEAGKKGYELLED